MSENEGMNTYLFLVYKLHLLTTSLNVFHLTGVWADYEKQITGRHGFLEEQTGMEGLTRFNRSLGEENWQTKNNAVQRNLADELGPNCRQVATLLQIPGAFSPKETAQCSQAQSSCTQKGARNTQILLGI